MKNNKSTNMKSQNHWQTVARQSEMTVFCDGQSSKKWNHVAYCEWCLCYDTVHWIDAFYFFFLLLLLFVALLLLVIFYLFIVNADRNCPSSIVSVYEIEMTKRVCSEFISYYYVFVVGQLRIKRSIHRRRLAGECVCHITLRIVAMNKYLMSESVAHWTISNSDLQLWHNA